MTYIISNKIYVKKDDCTSEMKSLFRRAYSFKEKDSNFKKQKEATNYPTYNTVYTKGKYKDIDCYIFPPNLDYWIKNIVEKTPNIEWKIIDKRVAPKIEGFVSNVTPRPNQIPILNEMEKFGYNVLVTAKTGFGKTASCLYLAEKLKSPLLFVAARTSLISNFSLIECEKFNISKDDIVEINTEWLENPVIKPIMITSVQALSEEILAELYDKVGILVYDEVHQGGTAGKFNDRICGINPRYRIYLSATPYNLNYPKEFTHCVLSGNIVDSPENINFNIDMITLNTIVPQSVHLNYNKVYSAHERRDALFTDTYLSKICELAFLLVKNEGRGIVIFNDDINSQERMAEMLRMWAIKVGVLNANASDKSKKHILSNFDNKGYEVIISGSSITAGVSLNRLSCIIDTSITINSNNVQQLVGRLKRQDLEVCDKNKLYIKVTSKGLSHKKWAADIQALKEFDYINFHQERVLEHYAKFSLVRAYKDFRENLI